MKSPLGYTITFKSDVTLKICKTVQVAMLEPKIALTWLALIFITTCQSFDSNVNEPELDPKGGSSAENLQIWKFKDGYLINKQLGKNYSYGNIIWSLEPPESKSYFHIAGKYHQRCPKFLFFLIMIFNSNLELDIQFGIRHTF